MTAVNSTHTQAMKPPEAVSEAGTATATMSHVVATTRFPRVSVSMERLAGVSRTVTVLPEGYSLFLWNEGIAYTLSFPKKEKAVAPFIGHSLPFLEKRKKGVSDLECVDPAGGRFSAI
jgi:hypothetical protein